MTDRGTPGGPTRFPELNDVLDSLVRDVSAILGRNLLGAYVQGSFALGDADLESDCDFLVVTSDALSAQEEAALRALHDAIPTRPGHWSGHLEGSYPPVDDLRTLDRLGAEWLYVDHGWREMQWSTHCNTEVVRWTLRKRGVTLCGPPPDHFAAIVPGAVIRHAARRDLATLLDDVQGWTDLEGVAWAQRYVVATTCRMLYSLETGEATSKRSAMRWAASRLDPRFGPLIVQADADRELGFDRAQPPRPGTVASTLELVAYAQRLAAASGDVRSQG